MERGGMALDFRNEFKIDVNILIISNRDRQPPSLTEIKIALI